MQSSAFAWLRKLKDEQRYEFLGQIINPTRRPAVGAPAEDVGDGMGIAHAALGM